MQKIDLAKKFWLESCDIDGQLETQLEFKPNVENELIELPDPKNFVCNENNFTKIIALRRTLRKYLDKKLTLEQLSFLLWGTQGFHSETNERIFRTVPSAGGTHPFETYLLINRVESLASGLYLYNQKEHTLQKLILKEATAEKIQAACLNQPQITTCSAMFIWVAIPSRTSKRYGIRAYRYFLMDAGHICQNLYLTSESIGCGACAIGAFTDEKFNDCLELDGKNVFVAYAGTVGFRT